MYAIIMQSYMYCIDVNEEVGMCQGCRTSLGGWNYVSIHVVNVFGKVDA